MINWPPFMKKVYETYSHTVGTLVWCCYMVNFQVEILILMQYTVFDILFLFVFFVCLFKLTGGNISTEEKTFFNGS